MSHNRPARFAAHRGFTLVESIIVLVVLAIAAAGIITLQGNIFLGQSDNRKLQVGVQLMQECAEQILAARRASGFDAPALVSSATASSSCSGMTLTGYTAPAVTVAAGNSTAAGFSACPYATGSNCKLVSITQGGMTPLTLMLVK